MNDRAGEQVLREVAVAVADGADTVIAFKMQTFANRMRDEPDERRVRGAGAETLLAARESETNCRHHGEERFVGVAPQTDFGADLRVADTVCVVARLGSREQTVGGEAQLDAIDHADSHEHGRTERANISRPLPLHAQLELDLAGRDDIRTGTDMRPVGVDRRILCEGQCEEQRDGGHRKKS